MAYYFDLIFVGPQQVVPIAVGVVLWLGLSSLGMIFTGKDRFPELNVFYGWAIASTLFTVIGVVFRHPFLVTSIGLAILAFAGGILAFVRKQTLFVPGIWRILLLAMPLFVIAGAMEPSQWDEFSHWLPASKYLLAFNGFPNAVQPFNGPQMLAAYPYGWPILSYLSALIAGTFVPNIGGTLNLLLLFTITTLILRTAFHLADQGVKPVITWGFASSVILCSTLFNPTFIQKIVLTSYSDIGTAVSTAAVLLISYYYLEALAKENHMSPWSGAWQIALLLMLIVNLRQSNLVLLILFSLAVGFIAWRDPKIEFKRFLPQLPLILAPAIITYLAWRYHVYNEFANIRGLEATFRPFDQWNIYEIPLILKQMIVVAAKKIGFFGPMSIAVYVAIVSIIKFNSSFGRIAILCAIGFLGYNAFLFLIYVGHFAQADALRVVSYWRYNTHVGILAVIFIVTGTVVFWSRRKGEINVRRNFRIPAIILVLILPIVFSKKLRFDLEPPKPYYTLVAKSLIGKIPKQSKVFVMDPKGNGEAGVITRYYLDQYGTPWLSAFQNPKPDVINQYLAVVGKEDFLLVHSIVPGLENSLTSRLHKNKSYLLKRNNTGWKVLRSWDQPINRI